MNRRSFFKNLIGGAVILSLPKPVINNIVAFDYQREPEKLFTNKAGVWIYSDDNELLGWSPLNACSIELHTEFMKTSLKLNTKYSTSEKHNVKWDLQNFHATSEHLNTIFMTEQNIIMVLDDGFTITGKVYMTQYNTMWPEIFQVKFNLTGELKLNQNGS